MFKREKKKEPGDYPMVGFQVSQETKGKLNALIDEVKGLYNSNLDENDKISLEIKLLLEKLLSRD